MGEKIKVSQRKADSDEKHAPSGIGKPNTTTAYDSPFSEILHLQRTIGNQAVTRLIQSGTIQAKLKIGQPDDMYEQEANRVADQVMRMPEPKQSLVNGHWSLGRKESEPVCPECIKEVNSPMIQRQVEEEEEEEEIIQTKPVSSSFEVNPDVESRIQSLTGSGQPLAQSTRNFFGPRFGVDFSHVRVHTDSRAAQTAQAINAQAYTTGNHIVFNRNQYAPGSIQGKYLLAHELTHVMQQNKDSRMIQSQENGGAATLAGLTARRTAFNNTGTTDADNCCAICPVNLGVGVAGGARNGMELEYTISGTIPAGTEFDITRTIRGADWQQDGGAWARINTIPAGTGDDHHNDDECLIPNRRRIFVEDRPGMPAMNPRGTGLNGVSVSATATAYVGKLNFFEWVIARNRRLGIGWTRISQPTFTTWHSITSVALVGGTWTRVNTPNGDANEIELGTVNTTGNTP